MRRLNHSLARLGAAFAVIAIVVVPIFVILRIAGNPFDPDAFERLADRRVDDTTIVKLLTIGFLIVWVWVVGPAIRQAHICLNSRQPSRRIRPVGRPIEAPADAPGPRGWLAQLVRFALTSTLITTVTTTSTLALAAPSAQAPQATEPAPAVVVDQSTDGPGHSAARHSVEEHIAGRRDTPYAIAAQRFSDRVDEVREEIVALNHGRPTPDGHMWRGGSFPEGMRVLLPAQTAQDDGLPNDSTLPMSGGDTEWPTHLPAQTVVVEPGDNVWNLTKARLDSVDGPEASPSDSDISKLVDDVIGSNTFASGDPNLIYPGETIDFPSIGTPSANGDQFQSGAQNSPPPETGPSPTVLDGVEPEVTTSTPVVSEESREDEPADAATTSGHVNSLPSEDSRASLPPPATVSPAVDQTRTAGETEVDDAEERESSFEGITGAVVLASALAAALTWERRRRRARGLRSGNQDVADVELAVVAASDIPFVRWVAQELAAMARSLDPVKHRAVPLAVELDEADGIEVLWDQPVLDAPHPWEATEGGWSWRTLYDPDEPTPASDWPTPLPGLVTIGARRGRQLLIDLEQIGTLSISGPGDRVDGLLRSMLLELAIGDDMSNAYVLSFGADGAAAGHGHRVEQVDLAGAGVALENVSATAASLIGNGETLFQQRLGPDPAIADNVTVVFVGPDVDKTAKEHLVSMVSAGRGMGAVIVGEGLDAAASIVVDEDGSASLAGIAAQPINFIACHVPLDSSATLERVLNPPLSAAPSAGTLTFNELAGDVFANDAPTVKAPENRVAESESDGPTAAEAALLGADDESSIPEPAVLIRLFGAPRVEGNPEIRGVSLRLLAYLACQSEPVSLSRIRHVVWGGAARDRKTVSNKLSQLRSILGTTEDGDALISLATAEGVSVHDSVVTDIRLFDELISRSEHLSSNAAIDMLRSALALIDGEPFEEAGYEWADLDARLHERIVDAAARLFELACEAGDLVTARDALVRGLQGVPGHEKLYRLRMQFEHRCVGPTAVHGVFNELTHQLDALDCEPSDETLATYHGLTGRQVAS